MPQETLKQKIDRLDREYKLMKDIEKNPSHPAHIEGGYNIRASSEVKRELEAAKDSLKQAIKAAEKQIGTIEKERDGLKKDWKKALEQERNVSYSVEGEFPSVSKEQRFRAAEGRLVEAKRTLAELKGERIAPIVHAQQTARQQVTPLRPPQQPPVTQTPRAESPRSETSSSERRLSTSSDEASYLKDIAPKLYGDRKKPR